MLFVSSAGIVFPHVASSDCKVIIYRKDLRDWSAGEERGGNMFCSALLLRGTNQEKSSSRNMNQLKVEDEARVEKMYEIEQVWKS